MATTTTTTTTDALFELGKQTKVVEMAAAKKKADFQNLKTRLAIAREYSSQNSIIGHIGTRARAADVHLKTMMDVYESQRATIKELRAKIVSLEHDAEVDATHISDLEEERDVVERISADLAELDKKVRRLWMVFQKASGMVVAGFVVCVGVTLTTNKCL